MRGPAALVLAAAAAGVSAVPVSPSQSPFVVPASAPTYTVTTQLGTAPDTVAVAANYTSDASGVWTSFALGLATSLNILTANTVIDPSGVKLLQARDCVGAECATSAAFLLVSVTDPSGILSTGDVGGELNGGAVTASASNWAAYNATVNAAPYDANTAATVPTVVTVVVGDQPASHSSATVGAIVGGWVGGVFLVTAASLLLAYHRHMTTSTAKAKAAASKAVAV